MDELANSKQQTQIMFIMIISLVIICFVILVFYVFGEKRKEHKFNSYMESDKNAVKIKKIEEINNSNNNSNNISKNLSTLKNVNEKLWDIEDQIRDKESQQCFDNEFIELARSVYFVNDERAKIKRELNSQSGSALVEEKSYSDYSADKS